MLFLSVAVVELLIVYTMRCSPYFAQALYYIALAPEQIPSAIERYRKETLRVLSVLDGVLAKSPSGYLVGGKATIADLAFVTWSRTAVGVVQDIANVERDYPAFSA